MITQTKALIRCPLCGSEEIRMPQAPNYTMRNGSRVTQLELRCGGSHYFYLSITGGEVAIGVDEHNNAGIEALEISQQHRGGHAREVPCDYIDFPHRPVKHDPFA